MHWEILAAAIALVGCDQKLSKDEALKLTPHAVQECDTTLAGMRFHSSTGVQYDASDKCGDALVAAGLLQDKVCDNTRIGIVGDAGHATAIPICVASLNGPQLTPTGPDNSTLRYRCGQVKYEIVSVSTEGAHATVQYNAAPGDVQPASLGDCAQPRIGSHHGTFTASRDDDGHWTVDDTRHAL